MKKIQKWDERASESYKKFELEQCMRDEMEARKNRHFKKVRTWDKVTEFVGGVLVAALIVVFLIMVMAITN